MASFTFGATLGCPSLLPCWRTRFGPAGLVNDHMLDETSRSLINAYRLRGSRIVNSLYSPTSLSTAMIPPCAFVTIS